MAAYAALVSLMQIIHQIKNHPFSPISLDEQQVESLTENVTNLQKFLEAYNSPVAFGDETDPLESRIANAAYAAEDVIESYIVDVIKLSPETDSGENNDSGEETTSSSDEGNDSGEETRPSTGEENDSGGEKTSSSDKGTTSGSEEEASTSSAEEINFGEEVNCGVSCINFYQDMHQVIEEMNSIKKVAMEIITQKNAVQAQFQKKISTDGGSSIGKDNIMVGFDGVLLEVLDKLTGGEQGRQIIPIMGMGGIGKTTLARNIFQNAFIKEHFDICVWTTISQQYNIREILSELVIQAKINIPKQLSEMREDEVGLALHKYLFGRRFLIVLDDMWDIDAWDKMQRFFPDNNNMSRIVVTTRLSKLGSQLENNYCLEMKFLDESSSWELFSKIVFGEKSCPLELKKIGENIVENCRGLPLSIIVVGGLLKKMEDTLGCWESVWENLTTMVNLENDKHCLTLLKLSYNHLPVDLKPCFLYMGVFEEDDAIDVSDLIKRWVSEGFLKPEDGKSLEIVAEGFLKDLIDRNLILIDKLGRTGNIKYCKLHDLLRDLCVREGQKYGFSHFIGQHSPPQGNNHGRRIVIPNTTSKEEVLDALQSMSHARSIICHDEDDEKVPACRNSRLLRSINAYNHVDGNPLVFEFVNLRHVIVEADCKLPINRLWNLHTLIVHSYDRLDVPVGIWKMPQLRHIKFMEHKWRLPDPPSGDADVVVVMENLQTLKGVANFKCDEEVVKRIVNIKRLLIEYDKVGDDDYYCLSNIKCLSKLESLTYGELAIEGRRTHHLQKLTFPHSIKKLTLTMSYDADMLEKIGSLPRLEKFKMVNGSFRSGKWEIVEGQFPRLKSLALIYCGGLKHWTAEESLIFPRLEQLRLSRLTELKGIPSEIGDISTLQEIELLNCSESVVKSVRKIADELEEYDVYIRVSVVVSKKFEALKSLATPNFEVEVTEYV